MHQSEMSLHHKPKSTLLCDFSPRKMIVAVGVIWAAMVPVGWAALATSTEKNVATEPAIIQFNSSFMHGAAIDVSRFDRGNYVAPGSYLVTVIVNNESRGKYTIRFTAPTGESSAYPCFTLGEIERLGIKLDAVVQKELDQQTPGKTEDCHRLESLVAGSTVNYDSGDFLLAVVVPQINVAHLPRGYIDPNTWDSGVTVGFLDYNTNIYTLNSGTGKYSERHSTTYTNNIGLQAGFNIAGWRLRKRLNVNWSNQAGMHTQNLLGYAQTDITRLKSQLTLGDSNTRGDVFDSFTLRGVQLQSDDRMLPEGVRNYVPVLRGNAETNAKVKVTQRGQTVYETTVPPGPFELTDVGAMGYGGDLLLTIIEADGRERSQNIPFSAPPMMLHEGISQFGLSVGQLKDNVLRSSPKVLQGVYQYGLTSMYTLYGGIQGSEHYRALAIGNSYNTPIGGFSLDGMYAQSDLRDDEKDSGNSFKMGYSKYIEPTNTNFTLAAYRYSTKGFYTFREASIARYGTRYKNYEADYRTRERLTLTLGQRLWNNAYINASGSIYNYWDNRPSAKQYSLSYNKSERYFSWALSASRLRSGNSKDVNSFSLSFNVPLGQSNVNTKPVFSSIYSTYSHDNAGNSMLQANANGSQGDRNELNYGIGTSAGRYSTGSNQQGVTGNVNYRSPYGQIGMTASMDSNSSKQLSLSMNGSMVAHQGGVTLGPQLSDLPFAIIDVPGGEGAKLLNGYGSTIDSNGYAIMPSLTAYRQNTVSIDAKGLPDTVDVLESESIVVPRAGSAALIRMKSIIGVPAILTVRDDKGAYMPIGTELADKNGANQSIVGQGGQAFIRGWDFASNMLYVMGNESIVCRVAGDSKIPENKDNQMVQLEVTCSH